MITLERRVGLLTGGARRETVWLRAEGLTVYVCESDGLVFDAAPLSAFTRGVVDQGRDAPRLDHVTMVLEGAQHVRTQGRPVDVGAGQLIGDALPAWDERWEGGPYRSLSVEWSSAHGDAMPGRAHGRMSRRLSSAARALAAAMMRRELRGAAGADAVARLLAALRAEGLPLAAPDRRALVAVPEGAQALADAVSWMQSSLHTQPMWVDVERRLGLSERQLRRHLARLGWWVGFPHGSMRRHLVSVRTVGAAALLSARGVKAKDVARSLGYGSERALVTALSNVGLPPPTALGRAVRAGTAL